ncbi:GMC oxidoreductase [Cognatiyoonia koreensis]|nr:GMC oxidoreductase [Cognatiyoonia koreensis]
MIRLQGDTLSEDMLIEEGVMPGALAAGYAAAFPVIDALMGDPFRFGDAAQRLQDMADVANAKSLADSAYDGPVARTLPFLVMSHDSSAGVLEMKADRISVRWKNAGLDPAIVADGAAISRASDAIKAEYLPMPFWQDAFGNRLITVHPIGGCAMGKDHKSGVVNSDCQVFRHDGGLYEGLFVCDGASLPGGVGVNPHLTITAVAERAMDELVKAQGWQTDTTPAKPLNQSVPSKPAKLGLSDLEKLHQALSELVHAITEGDLPLSKSKISNVWLMLSIAYAKLVPVDLKKRYPIASQETLFEVLKSDTDYTAIVLPIAEQMLDLLIASKPTGLRERLKNLETLTGDFSPGGGFDEIMRGRISSLGLTDNPASRDPFRVAAKAGANCTFTAKIRTEKIRRATTPPDGFLSIESGTFHSEAIGGSFFIKDGKFRFMMPDPEVVEKWEMTYAGNLMSAGSKDEQLRFECFKTIQRREGSHWWRDLTECRVKVFKDNVEIARGLLELELQDLIEQAVNLDISYTTKALMQGFIDAYEVIKGAGLDAPSTLPDVFDNPALRANLVLGVAHVLNENGQQAEKALTDFYKAQVLGKFGEFALRTYGGVFSYASNFQERDRNESLVKDPYLNAATYQFESEPGVWLQLTHYPGTKGPIVLAGGFGTCASSFALPTVDQNLVQALMAEGYDIWLFDYRGSGAITASQIPFTLDQVAQYDWPTAIDEVLKRTPVKNASDVQVLVHCIGSMSLFMALLYQRLPVRQVIASATGPFAITNWYNYAKSDVELSRYVAEGLPRQMWGLIDMLDLAPDVAEAAKHGLAVFDPRAPSPHPFYSKDIDNALTGLAWKVPGFAPTECYSPTCHRITFGFGPSYLHAQLNQATHNTIADLFGPVASRSFIHIAKIFERGTVIDVNGADIYMPNVANLDMPIHFIVGALNQEMLPEATLRAQHWLQQNNGNPERYTRHVYPNYGHMDCFIGKDADKHIFPKLLDMLSSRA